MPRGQGACPGDDPPEGRFGRMFPGRPACELGDDGIDELVRLMVKRAPASEQRDNLSIPAGFTYLGQFIDHDITFDPTPLLERRVDPRALVNFRTPRYDLDSVYGLGPRVQPFLYDWEDAEPTGTRLLLGRQADDAPVDLPRNHQGRALIGDFRNDENVIVAQLHLLFIQFHNAVVDQLGPRHQLGEAERIELFEEAQRIVRWHYQWIVVNDFLRAVAGEDMAKSVLVPATAGKAAVVRRRHFAWRRRPFIPVEFSGAAYRFGHSMVRNQYGIKRAGEDGHLPAATDLFPGLEGFTWLTTDRVIHWERFFRFPGFGSEAQPSFRIDTAIAKPLFKLPDREQQLPRMNLERGRKLGLPSGQVVAEAMGLDRLPEEALKLDEVEPERLRKQLLGATPLWYYVLCEAAHMHEGKCLGPVGGRIVAEVLVGLLEGDPCSFLGKEPGWRPTLGTNGEFTMADLVKIAQRAG